MTETFKLGDTVEDILSGFIGVAVARHTYFNGCSRVTVQPKVQPDGTLPKSEAFDEPQLRVIEVLGFTGKNDTGGPEKYSDVRKF